MATVVVWIYVIALMLAVYIGVVREVRLAIGAYVLQTFLVACAYALAAISLKDQSIWWAVLGLIVLRMILIPWLMYRIVPRDMFLARNNHTLISPTFAMLVYLLLTAVGVGIVSSILGLSGLDMGLALAILLVAIGIIAISHHALKQIMGILSADNAVDLLASLTLSRIALMADYMVFLEVTIAVVLLSLLMVRHRRHGYKDVRHMSELKG